MQGRGVGQAIIGAHASGRLDEFGIIFNVCRLRQAQATGGGVQQGLPSTSSGSGMCRSIPQYEHGGYKPPLQGYTTLVAL